MDSQIKAAQSYWIYKRDEAKANLDSFLKENHRNHDNPQEIINQLFKDFSDAMSVLSTINLIIESSKQVSTEAPETGGTNVVDKQE